MKPKGICIASGHRQKWCSQWQVGVGLDRGGETGEISNNVNNKDKKARDMAAHKSLEHERSNSLGTGDIKNKRKGTSCEGGGNKGICSWKFITFYPG